jgi:hypothetical protein
MAELDQRTDDYHPKDALGDAIKATLVTGGAGAFVREAPLAFSVCLEERFGASTQGDNPRLTARAAAMGGAYMFSKDAAANLRRKDDSYNSAIGGAFAGSMLGLKCA